MCGIVGIWGGLPHKQALIEDACRRIRHRGPDSDGYWQDERAGLSLGHVRLAILDVSAAGHQPMASADERLILVLNGEIYNHLALRASLEKEGRAPAWRGHSDTETVLAAILAWGVQKTLQLATGMFAMALWDRQAQSLTLIRDRMGEKPLYAGFVNGSLVFASELKALAALPGFDRTPDPRALSLLLRHNYIPAPFSIYASIKKLAPGTILTLTHDDVQRGRLPEAQAYWSATAVAHDAARDMLSFDSDEQAVDALEDVLGQAVGEQMISDVALGGFLSGGIDSSIIVALMQKHSSQPVRTFSIGFNDPAFNEAEHAQAVARHLGTTHTELYVDEHDALEQVPQLASIYDEPFADSSQIPTLLLTRMARQHVTVALSGDGGDELFGGYSRYFRAQRWWDKRHAIPAALHAPIALMGRTGAAMMPAGHRRDQFEKLAQVMAAPDAARFYQQFVSYWKDPGEAVINAELPDTVFEQAGNAANDLFANMTLLDAISYLPDDILVKVDRAAMAVSLETRVPMLDHRVFEFARRLPPRYTRRDGKGKWLLRQLLYQHVPRDLVDRPKKGFSVPMGAWLRGPLKDWGAALLDPARLRSEGLFHAEPILRKWREHQAGQRDWSTHLWSVLMTQAWLDEHKVDQAFDRA